MCGINHVSYLLVWVEGELGEDVMSLSMDDVHGGVVVMPLHHRRLIEKSQRRTKLLVVAVGLGSMVNVMADTWEEQSLLLHEQKIKSINYFYEY